MFTICGSGFGLYGYLPALMTLGEGVILPVAYKEKVQRRSELTEYFECIEWVPNIDDALSKAGSVILASPPYQQTSLVERCLALNNIERILVEKPIAVAPAEAIDILSLLERSGKRFEVAYTLLYTDWFESQCWKSNPDASIQIHWCFMAHHFANDIENWKRQHVLGGGALRFYGIHLLAVLAYFGYELVLSSTIDGLSKGEPEKWMAEISGSNLPLCRVMLDSRDSDQRFSIISLPDTGIVNLKEPFADEQVIWSHDIRVNALTRLLKVLNVETETLNSVYRRTNLLWSQAEKLLATG
jgi:predicted dehydrogenase